MCFAAKLLNKYKTAAR